MVDALKTESYDKKQPWGDTQTASLMENLKSGLNSTVPNTVLYDGLVRDKVSHCHRDIGLAWLDLPLKVPSVTENK